LSRKKLDCFHQENGGQFFLAREERSDFIGFGLPVCSARKLHLRRNLKLPVFEEYPSLGAGPEKAVPIKPPHEDEGSSAQFL
jgi:hypothetical protein